MPKASKNPVFQKLRLKPRHRAIVLHLTEGVAIGKCPVGAKIEKRFAGAFDLILGFYESAKELKSDLPRIKKALTKNGASWIAYRKGGGTDLSRDLVWNLAGDFGLDGVSMISIDNEWSGFKLMHQKAERK